MFIIVKHYINDECNQKRLLSTPSTRATAFLVNTFLPVQCVSVECRTTPNNHLTNKLPYVMKPKASFIRTDFTLSERKLEKCLPKSNDRKRERVNPCSLHMFTKV